MTHHPHMAHQERGIIWINRILVGCSMCLSGYFGWVIAEGVVPLNFILALLCGSVAYGVSLMFERAAAYNVYGLRPSAVICWVVGCLFLAANTLFDFSSAAAVRDAVATQAQNQNNKADDVRDQIKLIRKNIADARATTAWQATLQPAESYEQQIRNLEGDQTVMKRSKGCTDQTLDTTRAHCQKIADAKASLAMATQKAGYEKQVQLWEAELGKLSEKSEGAGYHSNPALAQVKSLVAMATGDLALKDEQIAWGQLLLMALMTVLVNAGLAFLGNEIGTQRALAHMHARDTEEADDRPPQRLAYHGPRDDDFAPRRNPEPVPLKPAPAHGRDRETVSETVIIQQGGPTAHPTSEDPNIKELLQRSQDAAAKAREMLAQMKAAGRA